MGSGQQPVAPCTAPGRYLCSSVLANGDCRSCQYFAGHSAGRMAAVPPEQRFHWVAGLSRHRRIAACYTGFIYLLEHVPVAKVMSYTYVNPVVAVLLGIFLLHERPAAAEFSGMEI